VTTRIGAGLTLLLAALAACGQSSAPSRAGFPAPMSSATVPAGADSPTSSPLPDVPAVFVAVSAGKIAEFDSVSGHLLRVLASPPPGYVDGMPRFGRDQHNRRVVYFVRSRAHNSCADSVWRITPSGRTPVRVFGRGRFWIRGLTTDPNAESLAFSSEDCTRGANGSGVYLISPAGSISGHISDMVPPGTNGLPGAGPLALAGDSLAIFVGYHNAPWIATAHLNRLQSVPRLIDLPRSGAPPKLPSGSVYCWSVGPPLWLRSGVLATAIPCYRGTNGRTAHTDSTLLVTLGNSGQRHGELLMKLAGARRDVDLLSSDNDGHLIGTVGNESDDIQYVRQVIEVSSTRQHLLPACDIRTFGCPSDPTW
jgi:hypothetical protein